MRSSENAIFSGGGARDSRLVGVGVGADVLEVCYEYTEGREWKGSEKIV